MALIRSVIKTVAPFSTKQPQPLTVLHNGIKPPACKVASHCVTAIARCSMSNETAPLQWLLHAPINGWRDVGEGPMVVGSPIQYRRICVSHYILEQHVLTGVGSSDSRFLYMFYYTAKINQFRPISPGVMYWPTCIWPGAHTGKLTQHPKVVNEVQFGWKSRQRLVVNFFSKLSVGDLSWWKKITQSWN